MKTARIAVTAIALVAICGMANSAPIAATSYDMPNGNGQASGGTYNYWDANYAGIGAATTDGASLTGGLGKLTDGVISSQPWYLVSNNSGTGEYVGWRTGFTTDPTITFNFTGSPLIDTITIYLDNTQIGGVYAPSAVVIDGSSLAFTAPAAGTVGAVTFSGLGLTGSSHTIQLAQDHSTPGLWVFASEITFDGPSARVPEPGALALVGLGLAGLAAARRRRR